MPLKTEGHIYLAKATDDVVSHCRCAEAYITFPPQMDCPWCGCGWLFTCISCRKAFTFAKGVIIPEPWEETARRDLTNRLKKTPEPNDVSNWVEAMKELLAGVVVGQAYVYLDGCLIPATTSTLKFAGWHSRHDLPFVPQVAARRDPSVLKSMLANRAYWQQNAAESARA